MLERLRVCGRCEHFVQVPLPLGIARRFCRLTGPTHSLPTVAGQRDSSCQADRWPTVSALDLPIVQAGSRSVVDQSSMIEPNSQPIRPPKKHRTVLSKAKAFLAAVTGPRVDEAEYQRRLSICQSNRCGYLRSELGGHRPQAGDKESETRNSDALTSGLQPPASRLYCGACGCPKWRLAELHTKLRFAQLECPADPPMW